jgi:hypothetical protein
MNARLFVTASLFIILFTVFFLGSTTKPVIKLLNVQLEKEEHKNMFMEINERVVDTLMSGIEEIADVHAIHSLTMKFHRINENILKRIFTKGDAHHLTHTYEAVKWNAIRRSVKRTETKKRSKGHSTTTTIDVESRLSLGKIPLDEEPSDDSVFKDNGEDVLYRRPAMGSPKGIKSAGMQSPHREEDLIARISMSSTTSGSHRLRPPSVRLRANDHLVHFEGETPSPTSPVSSTHTPSGYFSSSQRSHGRRRSTVSGRRVVSHMFAQSTFYHLPRRDSLVLPSTPVEIIPPSERRPSSTLYSLEEGDVSEKTNL